MDACISKGLVRKLEKFYKAQLNENMTDFVAEFAQEELMSRILMYQEDIPQIEQGGAKGVLLYERNPACIEKLLQLDISFDQIPFTAAMLEPIVGDAMPRNYSLLLSNLAFDSVDPGLFIQSMDRLLISNGRFSFSAFGPQTMRNARTILSGLSKAAHFNDFYELQDIGDALLGAGFKDVVVDSTILNIEYDSSDRLFKDAACVFGANQHPDRCRSLTPKGIKQGFVRGVNEQIKEQGKFSDQVEILIAHGRKPEVSGIGVNIRVT